MAVGGAKATKNITRKELGWKKWAKVRTKGKQVNPGQGSLE